MSHLAHPPRTNESRRIEKAGPNKRHVLHVLPKEGSSSRSCPAIRMLKLRSCADLNRDCWIQGPECWPLHHRTMGNQQLAPSTTWTTKSPWRREGTGKKCPLKQESSMPVCPWPWHWESHISYILWGWVMKCISSQHILLSMLMTLLSQAGSLQGPPGVSQVALAVNDLGSGSGWQQSKQNWTLPAVLGCGVRM